MKRQLQRAGIFAMLIFGASCSNKKTNINQPVYQDVSFQQDFSKKFNLEAEGVTLQKVFSDWNGVIQIYSSAGLLKTFAGEFLYPGTLVPDKTYRPMVDKKILNLGLYDDQFVYLDDKAVLGNAWAGNLYSRYHMPNASLFEGGENFSFLISDGEALLYLKDSITLWRGKNNEKIIDIVYDKSRNAFWLLGKKSLAVFSVKDQTLSVAFPGDNFTCFAFFNNNKEIAVGTTDGYLVVDADSKKQKGEVIKKLPWTEITAIKEINGNLWFGTTRGAFTTGKEGNYNYYASKRWLPSDRVVDLEKGPDYSVLILTDKGLGQICFKEMTLSDKADFFERQVRARHIRHGFNATMGYMKDGDLATGSLEDSDNDGLWTSMYLGAEVFRYAVTKSDEALRNIREAMEAMERLYTINKIKGFPSRSFERRGYKYDDKPWRRATDPEWDWKSTTSSDEAIGHIFAFGVMAELLDDQKELQTRAVILIDSLMQHVIDNNFYLIDWDGKPTLWGKWHPDYVNTLPIGVGDRKLNASNIVAMFQTAYRFTGKEIYKEKAFELMTKYGYFENLMFPMVEVKKADENADELSKDLSENWNHSDDEMYFLGYWGLYRYAFNDTLKENFKRAILDHWQIERPEKEGAWNIFTALTGVNEFDLEEAAWYLREYPLDLIHWRVMNSHRKDIELIEPNFRRQTTKEVLPPDELLINRHNSNRFDLDGGDGGLSEYSAGDIWLLPYWMGRYLNVISEPQEKKSKR